MFSIFKNLFNLFTIQDLVKDAQTLVQKIVEQKGVQCEDTKAVFSLLRRTIESGIVNVPNVENHSLAVILHDLENHIVCKVHVEGEKNLNLLGQNRNAK